MNTNHDQTPSIQDLMARLIEAKPGLRATYEAFGLITAKHGYMGKDTGLSNLLKLHVCVQSVLENMSAEKPFNERHLGCIMPSLLCAFHGHSALCNRFLMALDCEEVIAVIDPATGEMIDTDDPASGGMNMKHILVLKPDSPWQEIANVKNHYVRAMTSAALALEIYPTVFAIADQPEYDGRCGPKDIRPADAREFTNIVSQSQMRHLFNTFVHPDTPGHAFAKENMEQAEIDAAAKAEMEAFAALSKEEQQKIMAEYDRVTNEAGEIAQAIFEAEKARVQRRKIIEGIKARGVIPSEPHQ